MNCDGTAPPTTFSANSTPDPRGSGVTTTSHTAYCPWPAGLLDQPAVPADLGGEGLAQPDAQRDRVDVCAGRAQAFQHDVGVRLAEAPQHELRGLRVRARRAPSGRRR